MSDTTEVKRIRPEIEARLPEYVKDWTKVGLSTKPLDQEKIKGLVREHYKNCGYEVPEDFQFHFVGSPLAGARKAAELVYETPTPDNNQIREMVSHCGYGTMDAPWMAYYQVFIDDGQIPLDPMFQSLINLGAECGFFWAMDEAFVVSELPQEIHLDENNELHNPNGPAYWHRDGFAIYAWHGVSLPANVITENPDDWTPGDIFSETNQEVRRAKMERYGWERFAKNNTPFQRDDYGALYKFELPSEEERDLYIVEVVNSTPEPDGTYKKYYLRVPPHTTSAREAVAATFGMEADEYQPLLET